MSDKYRTEYKSGGGAFSAFNPTTERVIDRETGKTVGELTRWEHEKSGDKIADGDWDAYDDDDD